MKRFAFKMLLIALGLAGAAFAQEADTARVPIKVNVDAAVSASPPACVALLGVVCNTKTEEITVTADVTDTLRLPLIKTTGVSYLGAQRRANAPSIVANRGGNVTVNLPAQSYNSAEAALYTVNGKRILSGRMSSSNAVNTISRRNVATGVYLLSVRGADGEAVTARVTHSGGGLAITAAFTGGSGNIADARKTTAKKAEDAQYWDVKVSAGGYKDSVFTVRAVAGINPLLNITLRSTSSGGDSYESVTIGNQVWMKKNLNIETSSGSWCYNNSVDSCAKYGRLYTWTAAMSLPDSCATKSCASQISSKHRGICPSGWHLPSRQEWQALVDSVGGSSVAGKKLKSKTGWKYYGDSYIGTDEYGFSALPGGLRYSDGNFDSAGYLGYWWTATESVAGYAYDRDMYYGNDNVNEYGYNKSYAFSARCVED